MAGIYGYSREAVRVKVKKCESNHIEWRKFSVDPQITTVEVLYSILAKAFDIRSDFSISYRAIDPNGHEQFLAVLSDWDLDAAFLRTHNYSVQTGNEPCLYLRVDIKAFSEANDWEVNSPLTGGGGGCNSNSSNNSHKQEYSPIQQSLGIMGQKYVQNMQTKLPGLIMNHMEKTFSMVQRALNFAEEQIPSYPPRQPLSDIEFRSFLDSVGQILRPNELRKVIFLGGIDPSLRRVVWKHILNVYPNGMTGRERMDYMKRKATEYFGLRDIWKLAVQKGPVNGELAYVTSMVRKDVLRTDRLNQFYAGSDDNQNIASLFNVLTTYALNHPSVSYCQGMSDLASPLLVTMSDEAHAYICFCAIMSRLHANFMLDGIAMTLKFNHLAEAIQYYDPEFYEYLKSQQADDLLFCYRWLLLELKREFPFEDSLRMLEVQWSSLRNEPPEKELKLYEKEFTPPQPPPPIINEQQLNDPTNQQHQQQSKILKSPGGTSAAAIIMRQPRENHYTKVCALRRQSSSLSLQSNSPDILTYNGKLDATRRLNQSLDENISRRNQQLSLRKNIVKSHQSLDEQKMLMLMKSVSICETTKSDDDDDDNTENDLDKNEKLIDDKSNNIIQNIETATKIIKLDENYDNHNDDTGDDKDQSSKIQFHPTNPFLHDALGLDDVFMGNNTEILRPKILNDINNDKQLNNIENINSGNNDDNHKKDSKHNNNNNNKYGFNHISHKTIMKVPNINSNNHKNTIFSNTGNILTKQLSNKKGGHFKDLKDKIAASKKGILASLDKMESQFELTTSTAIINRSTTTPKQSVQDEIILTTNCNNNELNKGQKVVKNFNEFLNFTSSSLNKNHISDKLIQDQKNYRPLIKLKKESLDDSDLSTRIIDTTATMNNEQHSTIIKQPLQLQLNTFAQQQHQQHQSFDGSSPDDSQDYYPMTTSITRELRLEMENLDRQVFGEHILNERSNKLLNNTTEISYEKLDCKNSIDLIDVKEDAIISCPEEDTVIIRRKIINENDNEIITINNTENNINDPLKRISTCSNNTDIFVWENPLHQISGTSSCNFNEILVIDQTNNDDTVKYTNNHSKIFLPSIGTDQSQTLIDQNQTTPDEQQDLEYDGDIIIECDGDNINNRIHKSCTPLRLIPQQMSPTNQLNNSINNDSDSDNTTENNLWKNANNLNPFFSDLKKSNELITNVFNINDSCLINNDINDDDKAISNLTDEFDTNLISLNNPIAIINPQLLCCEEIAEETNEISFSQKQHQQQQQHKLPPPNEFGGGNPFLIFLCLTLLLQHRNTIIKNSMDYNEMAMHFDKMVRKHDVNRVLNQARRMYFEYLKAQNSTALLTGRATAVSGSGNDDRTEPTKS